jgi:hypothetical protein
VKRVVLDPNGSFAWIADPDEWMQRASVALSLDGGCVLFDPVDAAGLDEAIAPLGTVLGVCSLVDRHERDAATLAARHGAPRLVPSTRAGRGEPLALAGVQERAILAFPGWHESALWLPDRLLLLCMEALGTVPHFLAEDDEAIGVHPVLRPWPPRRALGGIEPDVIAVGHGPPVTKDASGALERALDSARRGLASSWRRSLRGLRDR